jgi:hypothetical protein
LKERCVKNTKDAELMFPPYGYLNADLQAAMREWPYPEGYEPPLGQAAEATWKKFVDGIAAQIADALWPRWTAGGWQGKASGASMRSLTEADLDIMGALRPVHEQAVRQRAKGAPPMITTRPHAHFFRVEDNAAEDLPVLKYLSQVDQAALAKAAEAQHLPAFHERAVYWMDAHCIAAVLPLKDEIQRPRPYQVTSLLHRLFDYERAVGAVTSALPSGHCIQGVIGVCSAWLELDAGLPPVLEARLRQYAVDHGDRRVFAGVHYPSDNLASWCLALALCDPLYRKQAKKARGFLTQAITQHSVVYQAIRQHPGDAYAAALTWFNKLAGIKTTS